MPYNILNPILASHARGYSHQDASIRLDLRNDPRNPHLRTTFPPYRPVHPLVFLEPATRPPVRYVRIVVHPLPNVRLSINIRSDMYVSVGQILEALYRDLRRPLARYEWAGLSSLEKWRVSEAFFERCSMSPNRYYDRHHGVRRIDLLCRETLFRGLEPSHRNYNTWKLVLMRHVRRS